MYSEDYDKQSKRYPEDSDEDENEHHAKKRRRRSSSNSDVEDEQRASFSQSSSQDNDSQDETDRFNSSRIQTFYNATNFLENSVTEKEENISSKSFSDVTGSSPVKNSQKSTVLKGSVAERMMKKWGYQTGAGIGKELQGRAEPVATSTQKGRRGLGLELKELEFVTEDFDPREEVVEIPEKIEWIENELENAPNEEELKSWVELRKYGPRPKKIDNETTFCDASIVRGIVNAKSAFDRLDKNEMREARTRSNPYETIRKSIFLNRAAVKMANIDKACDFMFTKFKLPPDEPLYFADVCAGPGGFSEYVLYRRKWRAKGFGFTLKNENDFKLHDFHAGPSETFHPYYGPKDNGDVYDPENQTAFAMLIDKQTSGVHFMMADGGFSVEGQENIQEVLSKQLYLCQCLVALMTVRPGGHFVTKVFDLFTPFSAGLIYIMYRCFKKISIFKPNTSRPANSERYLICQEKLEDTTDVMSYLYDVNKYLLENNEKRDILELVPEKIILKDSQFYNYLKSSNEELGKKQIVGLKKIAVYTEEKELIELRQKDVREQCLKHWELPDEPRPVARRSNPQNKAQELLGDHISILQSSSYKNSKKLTLESSQFIRQNPNDWFCVPCAYNVEESALGGPNDDGPTFYLGLGKTSVYRWIQGRWMPFNNPGVELPRDTLVYAEWVLEMRREDRAQSKTYALHIIDALCLGGENISQKFLTERHRLIKMFCKAIWKPVDRSTAPVRVKKLIPVDNALKQNLQLSTKRMKNGANKLCYAPTRRDYENDNEDTYYYPLGSVIFFKATQEPWHRHWGNREKKMYLYNIESRSSIWETPDIAGVNFAQTIKNQLVWNYPNGKDLSMDDLSQMIHHYNSRKR
ncbi:cap-specific mRNA (nucleoside-2'-O-)-methyltransferase 1 isoform X1 [Trichogramma pretiosum]|uniref:cap-specific mRNA (nucleoside-2'-O-)-methyltransferase 1 isoform X1 n=1 Tax=Trichogramma pretiosum TaxID=7493 RepID=UPI0006C953A1|nr:cap-specific mRNA (nucleoside-2'-O-)-methyltransferase 1 isoform X1 [Trichogramma pretiosum]